MTLNPIDAMTLDYASRLALALINEQDRHWKYNTHSLRRDDDGLSLAVSVSRGAKYFILSVHEVFNDQGNYALQTKVRANRDVRDVARSLVSRGFLARAEKAHAEVEAKRKERQDHIQDLIREIDAHPSAYAVHLGDDESRPLFYEGGITRLDGLDWGRWGVRCEDRLDGPLDVANLNIYASPEIIHKLLNVLDGLVPEEVE